MIYRVSYYLKSEMIEGRAPRHMVDEEAMNPVDAVKYIKAREANPDNIVEHGVYAAKKPFPTKFGFIYLTNDDRVRWYAKVKDRFCKTCKTPIGKSQRQCASCKEKELAEKKVKKCKDCGVEITHRHRCDKCADLRANALKTIREAKNVVAKFTAKEGNNISLEM